MLELFQFHKGTIKTRPYYEKHRCRRNFNSIKVRLKRYRPVRIYNKYLFQFHKGTIKTVPPLPTLRNILNFNSIKVRLKQLVGFEGFYQTIISIP